MAELDPTGNDVVVDEQVTIRTPGLEGEAEVLPPTLDGLRGPAEDDPALADALADAGLSPQHVIALNDTREPPAQFAATRTAYGDAAIEIDVPGPNPGLEQLVLYTDEAGVMTWHFAGGASSEGTVRGDGRRTYRVARRVPPSTEAGGTRNLAFGLAKKVIRVLSFKAADPLVDFWEAKNRPHRLRTFTDADKGNRGTDLVGDALRPFAGKRSLLFIHGTSSTTDGGFAHIHPQLLAHLQARYEGRVFAFDHPTIATDPDANVRWLLDNLPGDGWDLDVIGHSRGGLVARKLVEQASDSPAAERINVPRVVFLGTPNAGTPLADTQQTERYVDVMTNVLQFFAVGVPIAGALASILEVVKNIAAGAVNGLVGLQSMHPTGNYLRDLNGGNPETRFFGLASNFEPGPGGGMAFKDRIIDTIFGSDVANDLVVPTLGVYDLGSSKGSFPLTDYHVFPTDQSVDHSAYIAKDQSRQLISTWLA